MPLLEQALQAARATGAAIEVGPMATTMQGSEAATQWVHR